MNYHNILHDDMRNGDGLRVILFVSGCNHQCKECQNPQTWDCKSGIPFDEDSMKEILNELKNDYIDGITFSGGDPLHESNVRTVFDICQEVRHLYPEKTIWVYTGYKWEEVMCTPNRNDINVTRQNIVFISDVLVDGKFDENRKDVNYHWAGSSNQRIIDIKKSLEEWPKVVCR